MERKGILLQVLEIVVEEFEQVLKIAEYTRVKDFTLHEFHF